MAVTMVMIIEFIVVMTLMMISVMMLAVTMFMMMYCNGDDGKVI